MLTITSLYKTFNKGTVDEIPLFNDFNLSVKKGEFVSIVGSNGSGKTTLLNLISGNMPIDSGNILINSVNVTNKKEFKISRQLGRVFQNPVMGTADSMTIAENLALAQNKNKSYNLSFGLNKKLINSFKEQLSVLDLGLEDKINMQVGTLSGGQRQALTLLIATMTPIDLLLLDEHTAALDPKTSEKIMTLTDKIVREKGITTLMVTHNLRFAVEYGSRILMFNKGQVIIDKSDEEKQRLKVNDLLDTFNEISIECGN